MQEKQTDGESDETGDPGLTPGAAEGDRETVEADLKEKENSQNNENSEEDEQ